MSLKTTLAEKTSPRKLAADDYGGRDGESAAMVLLDGRCSAFGAARRARNPKGKNDYVCGLSPDQQRQHAATAARAPHPRTRPQSLGERLSCSGGA